MRIRFFLTLLLVLTINSAHAGLYLTRADSEEVDVADHADVEQVNFTLCYRASFIGDYRGGIVKNPDSGNYPPYELIAASDGSVVYWLMANNTCTGWAIAIATSPKVTGEVHTYCASNLSGGSAKLYVDGILSATSAGATAVCNKSQPVAIGRSNVSAAQYWNGPFYEAVYWAGQKSDAFILDWHNGNGRVRYDGPDKPVFHLVFNDGIDGANAGGSTIRDLTGNGHDGTCVNSPLWSADPMGYP